MKTLLHVSDLHFGRTNEQLIETLLRQCASLKPDIVVITGDLTQRALEKEFIAAKKFIDTLSSMAPVLATPGNHDIRAFFQPWARVFAPLARYEKFIDAPLSEYADDSCAIMCVNTARAWRIKGGSVSSSAVNKAMAWFSAQPKERVRIIASHHPLDLPQGYAGSLAKHAKKSIRAFAHERVDLYLSGHYHQSSVITTSARYKKSDYAAIAVQAGTVSTRSRGELQSFNLLSIAEHNIKVMPYLWDKTKKEFAPVKEIEFVRTQGQWVAKE